MATRTPDRGGVVPLGFQAKDRKITVVAEEAKTDRHIFRRYLDLGSLNHVLTDLRRTGVKTKVRPLSNGRAIGGIPFTRGSLASLLRNRFYISEVKYKGEVFPPGKGQARPRLHYRAGPRNRLEIRPRTAGDQEHHPRRR
jgi:site-specific DNA recombinase